MTNPVVHVEILGPDGSALAEFHRQLFTPQRWNAHTVAGRCHTGLAGYGADGRIVHGSAHRSEDPFTGTTAELVNATSGRVV